MGGPEAQRCKDACPRLHSWGGLSFKWKCPNALSVKSAETDNLISIADRAQIALDNTKQFYYFLSKACPTPLTLSDQLLCESSATSHLLAAISELWVWRGFLKWAILCRTLSKTCHVSFKMLLMTQGSPWDWGELKTWDTDWTYTCPISGPFTDLTLSPIICCFFIQ